MKPIFYAGAALMLGASIYGVVDYEKTKNRKEFTTMYNEEKNITPVTTEPAANNVKTAVLKTNTDNPTTVKKEEKSSSATVNTATTSKVKKVKKKKRLRLDEFSRAPIRD